MFADEKTSLVSGMLPETELIPTFIKFCHRVTKILMFAADKTSLFSGMLLETKLIPSFIKFGDMMTTIFAAENQKADGQTDNTSSNLIHSEGGTTSLQSPNKPYQRRNDIQPDS
jgi:hypothetical protein